MFSCVDYDDIQPFTGKTLPRKSGYSTGVTNDWIYFNLRTGESFNTYTVNKDIKEGEQINRTDWDLAFCGYTMRTNSGTSGIGQGGAADLGYGGYDDWTSVSQLPSDLEWVVDTDDVRVTMSQNDWNHYLVENGLDFDANPWFDPNNGPATTETNANPLLSQAMSFSGPPPHTPLRFTRMWCVPPTERGTSRYRLSVGTMPTWKSVMKAGESATIATN